MKLLQFSLIGLVLLTGVSAIAQSPVKWDFSSKKLDDKRFEIRLTATIQNGWHLYACEQPPDAIAFPTTVKFRANPLVQFKGFIKTEGSLTRVKEETLGIEAWQFADRVSFVQVIELKGKVKTNLNGSIEFQACTDEKCLPNAIVNFKVPIE
jgi:Disulphide bond corrector protein DsbC